MFKLNYLASIMYGSVAIVLLFAYAVLFHRPVLAGYALYVAGFAWAACYLGAAASGLMDGGSPFWSGVIGMVSLALTLLAVMIFLFAVWTA